MNRDKAPQAPLPPRNGENVVDELEATHIRVPGVDERHIDPASATHEGTGDLDDDEAGASEPPD